QVTGFPNNDRQEEGAEPALLLFLHPAVNTETHRSFGHSGFDLFLRLLEGLDACHRRADNGFHIALDFPCHDAVDNGRRLFELGGTLLLGHATMVAERSGNDGLQAVGLHVPGFNDDGAMALQLFQVVNECGHRVPGVLGSEHLAFRLQSRPRSLRGMEMMTHVISVTSAPSPIISVIQWCGDSPTFGYNWYFAIRPQSRVTARFSASL